MATTAVFVDTGAFFALEYARDQHHQAAQAIFARIRQRPCPLITTALVLSESVNLLHRRVDAAHAVAFGERVLNSRHIEITPVDEGLVARAWDEFRRHAAAGVSLVDCVSRVVIRDRNIVRVFAFDQHLQTGSARLLAEE